MLKTIDIDADNIDQAVALLDKGFPAHGITFWHAMLARIRQIHLPQAVQSLGDLLCNDGKPVGVLLKIRHRSPAIDKPIINLSSWYVEPEFRWYAPRMLLRATSDKDVIYTDLSPSPEVSQLNEKLGFKTISSQKLIFVTPLAAIAAGSKSKIYSASATGNVALTAKQQSLLAAHHGETNQALIIDDGEMLHPVIFQLRKCKGFRCANLIFCENLKALQRDSAAVARHMLKQRIMLMTMPAIDEQRPRGAFCLKSASPHQVKGEWPDHMVDQTYSEAVLLPYMI